MKNNHLSTYLKGIFMGLSDLVPGISGGTIAFITGIYQRLINSISDLGFYQLKELFSNLKNKKYKQISKLIKKYNYDFLFFLFLGIISAIFLGATGISYLFENYTIYTLSFFVGLIISSCFIIFKNIENTKKNSIYIIIGFMFGFSLLTLNQTTNLENISSLYLLFSGILASSAMILPGISGSFILLILGIYPIVLNYVSNPFESIYEISIFFLGIVIGILFLSKLLKKLFEKYKNILMSILLGIVIGALSIPIYTIYDNYQISQTPLIITLSLLGLLFGILIQKIK